MTSREKLFGLVLCKHRKQDDIITEEKQEQNATKSHT